MSLLHSILAQAATAPAPRGAATPGNGSMLSDTGRNGVAVLDETLRQRLDVLNHPDSMTQIIGQIHVVWATIFIILGCICVLNGYRWHKSVVVLLAGLSGVWAGTVLGRHLGDEVIVATCMAVLCAVIAWPFLRYAAAIFGGLAGAFAGANVWTALGYDPVHHHFGALMGLIIIGMLAFMTYRVVVIVLTTVGGASLLVIGALSLLTQVDAIGSAIDTRMHEKPLMIPLIVGVAVAIGAVFQSGGGVRGLQELADKAESKKAKAA